MALVLSPWMFFATLLFVAYGFDNEEASEKNSRSIWRNGPCAHYQFRCLNDKCISGSQFCDGQNNCGDDSDEQYCSAYGSCPSNPPHYVCSHHSYDRCIPLSWKCDGKKDCNNARDEEGCVTDESALNLLRINKAKTEALEWILESRYNESLSHKWGEQVARKAIAWYLGYHGTHPLNNTLMSEMAYEVSLSLLSRVALKTLKGVPTLELATYTNALLVTCVDPKNFYGMDLVNELRDRTSALNETHPSVTLALCNAGDVTENDVTKTFMAFLTAQQKHRTDVAALAVLALSCAVSQDQDFLDSVDMTELTSELKKKQYRNGTVESLKTTALVMQALYASERDADEDNFDETKALLQILKAQMSNGSFGNLINTYYVLPVLSYRSLVNVSSSHCAPRITDEKGSLQDLMNLVGRKSKVKFSLWIGNNRTVEKTISLKVPFNTSFYGVMEWAARVDTYYRFEYSMREKKPYIYSISGVQDDPENSHFWFLHSIGPAGADKPILISKSPADVYPTNGQHLVFWYKSD